MYIEYLNKSKTYFRDNILIVHLKMFDALGNGIATPLDESIPAGSYEFSFNASHLSSGIYFYRLRVGSPSTGSGQGFVKTKKMQLLK